MQDRQEGARKALWVLDKLLGAIFACAMFVLLLIGLYSLWDSKMVYAEADSGQWQAYNPQERPAGFQELRDRNPDVWGWLTIYGTNIDNPLLYNKDNPDKYLDHDALGRPSSPGSLYIEASHDTHLARFNTIIYGHHMENDLMFGGLDHFRNQSYLDGHRYGKITYMTDSGKVASKGLEVVGFIPTEAYDGRVYRDPIDRPEAQAAYVGQLKALMSTSRPVPWRGNRVVLLSTCASGETNARSVVICYVEDTIHRNTFTKKKNQGIGINQLDGLFGFPWLGWVGLILLICIISLLIIWQMDRRRRAKAQNRTTI